MIVEHQIPLPAKESIPTEESGRWMFFNKIFKKNLK
jgi:hypothetical protein